MFKLSLPCLLLTGLLWPPAVVYSINANAVGIAAPPVVLPDQILESNQAAARLRSVAVGDVNGDGYDDLIGGAPFLSDGDLDTEQFHEGAIYVHLGSPAGLSAQPSRVIQSNLQDLDGTRLGYSVSSGGDLNGDGYDDVLVGASRYRNLEGAEGAVYVFFGGPGTFDPTPDAILASGQSSAFMGWDVAMAGDVNADGFDDVIASVPNYSHGETNEGAALIYFGGPGAFDTTFDAIIETNLEYQQVNGVAAAGDVNGDGYDDVLVGNSRLSNGETGEGLVWLYHGGPGAFDTTLDAQFESNWVNASFGPSNTLAGNGDLDGDGRTDIVLGALRFSDTAENQGAFYVYLNKAGGMDTVPELRVEGNSASEFLGLALRVVGDIDKDGHDDLAAVVPGLDAETDDEGGVYIYRGGPGGVGMTPELIVRSGATGLNAGTHLASGDFNGDGQIDIAFGAPDYGNGQAEEGALLIKYGPLLGNDRIFANGFELLP